MVATCSHEAREKTFLLGFAIDTEISTAVQQALVLLNEFFLSTFG